MDADAERTHGLYRGVSGEEAAALVELGGWFERVYAAPDKCRMRREVAKAVGMTVKSVQNRYYRWAEAYRKTGDVDLANLAMRDRRLDGRRSEAGMGGALAYRVFLSYAAKDTNTSSGGWDAMMREFRAGKVFVDFGGFDWRDVWRTQNPHLAVPAVCPGRWVPQGWTKANMYERMARDASAKMALAWSRQGQFAALGHTLPVIRSRVGLHVGEVYQSDDVWHNVDVFKTGVKGVFNPLEFAFYDVASAYKAMSLMKPRTPVTDPKTGREKRDGLKEMQYRFAVAYLMCCRGFYRGGVTLVGERGTSRLNDTVLRRIAAVPGYGRLFRFVTSGLKNTPAHKGLFIGNAGGNPRMKSLCECAHNIMHNASASLPGSHGRDAAHLHESNAALVRYSADTIEQARRIDPAIIPLLQLPILDYDVYASYFYAIEDEVMGREEHRLEGWDGKWVTEYRLAADAPWRNVEELKDMAPERAAAVAAVVGLDRGNLMRQRRMSRRDAWLAGQKDLVRWPLEDMPAFLDPRDARESTVRDDGTISFADALYYPGQLKRYVAQYADRRTGVLTRLAPGTRVRFYWCPLGELADRIWISDGKGEAVGMCPILKTASWANPESVKAAMGQQLAQTAALMAETRAAGEMSGVRKCAAEKVNAALLAAAKEAGARGPAPDGEGYSLDDLNGAAAPEEDPAAPGPGGGNADALAFLDAANAV